MIGESWATTPSQTHSGTKTNATSKTRHGNSKPPRALDLIGDRAMGGAQTIAVNMQGVWWAMPSEAKRTHK
eukprot:15430406-Alexandrium_andersonii.AAC.1